jgi:hemolysin activation/secretion protein
VGHSRTQTAVRSSSGVARASRAHWLILAAGLVAGLPGVSQAQDETAPQAMTPAVVETPEFSVGRFTVRFDRELSGLPTADELLASARPAVRVDNGVVTAIDEPAKDGPTLAQLSEQGPLTYSRRALENVTRALVQTMSARGYLGVLAAIDPDDLAITVTDPSAPLAADVNEWRDLRAGAAGDLDVILYAAKVVRVRTVASGSRFPASENINNPAHERVLRYSPIVAEPTAENPAGNVLRRDLLDDYTLRLNRYPGRRVDAAIAAADTGVPGDVALDYMVREFKPWTVYAQIANTGTRQTEEVRERFGFIHNQLTNNDDQLVIDFVTAGFSESHAVSASYEFPIGDKLRFRPFATYSSFDASQVGQGDEGFEGESYSFGGELSYNVLQFREWFIDLTGGLRWESIDVDNQTVAVSGRDHFLLPSFGARVERRAEESSTAAYVRFETNLSSIAGTGDPSLESLGRLDADEDWWTFQWGAEHTFFLEPLLDAQNFRDGKSTLAHEVALSARGQVAFDDARLAPNFQDVIGGAATVRGYPESLVAGDNTIVGTIEYRLHFPSLLEPYDERNENPPKLFGEDFRLRPQTRYVRPDWDLIGKVFLDAGRAENNDSFTFEQDETLLGTGVGLELLLGRNLNIRGDFGVALEEVETPTRVTAGSSRLHFSITVLF